SERLYACVNEEEAEEVNDGVPGRDKRRPGRDEGRACRKCSEDAPEEDPVLLCPGNAQAGEDHDEQEEVVDAEALRDRVGGDELDGCVPPELHTYPRCEEEGHADPPGAPENRLLAGDAATASMPPEVEGEAHE